MVDLRKTIKDGGFKMEDLRKTIKNGGFKMKIGLRDLKLGI